jgi:hypothetical protein
MSRKRPTVMSFLQRPKRHDQKDMRFFKDIATLVLVDRPDAAAASMQQAWGGTAPQAEALCRQTNFSVHW